jgi:hypothetical protein
MNARPYVPRPKLKKQIIARHSSGGWIKEAHHQMPGVPVVEESSLQRHRNA